MSRKTDESTPEQVVPTILSIGSAHELVQKAMSKGDFDTARRVGQITLSNSDILGDCADYHNLATAFSRADDYLTAFLLVEKGLGQFPYNITLLADAVYYGSNCNEYEKCEQYIATLKKRPLGLWNWRAFTFLIDYYMGKSDWVEDTQTLFAFTDEALELALSYQQVLPTEEKAYMAESKVRSLRERYYLATLDHDKAQTEHELCDAALLKAINAKTFPAVQCCLRYADRLFEQQRYEEVIGICERALQYGEDQPSARLGYFLYLSAQAKDALIHQEKAYADTARIQSAFDDYEAAYRSMDNLTYQNNIETRAIILSTKSGVALPKALDDSDPTLSQLSALQNLIGHTSD